MNRLNFCLMGLAVLSLVSCSSQKPVGKAGDPSPTAETNSSKPEQIEQAVGAGLKSTSSAQDEQQEAQNFYSVVNFSLIQLTPLQRNAKWGYADGSGKAVITPQFHQAEPFSEGLAAVKAGDRWGYIDQKGKMVIKPQFTNALPFSEGIAAVQIGEKSGYIDREGKFVIHADFDPQRNFPGLTIRQKGRSWSLVVNQPKKKRKK